MVASMPTTARSTRSSGRLKPPWRRGRFAMGRPLWSSVCVLISQINKQEEGQPGLGRPWSTAQIPGEEGSSPQEADHSAKGQEGAEGDRRFPALSASGQQGNGHGASAPYADQDGQEGELPSKEGPDHGSELRVTPAHAPARRQEDDEYEGAATDQDAQQNVEPALRTAQQTEQGADHDPRQRNHVGDDLVVQVDPADDHERGEEDHGRHEVENGHRAPGGHGEEKAGQELDGWATPGDGSGAGAA